MVQEVEPTDESPPEPLAEHEAIDLAGQVKEPTVSGLALGYTYGVTRHADVILHKAYPSRWDDLMHALEGFKPILDELRISGGNRTVFVKRFDDSLKARLSDGHEVWGKQNITIERAIGLGGVTKPVSRVRSHEIDMLGKASVIEPFPGDALNHYEDPTRDAWRILVIPALRRIGSRKIARMSGLNRRTIDRLISGSVPAPVTRERVLAALLAATGGPRTAIESNLVIHLESRQEHLCLACGASIEHRPRSTRFCSDRCRMRFSRP